MNQVERDCFEKLSLKFNSVIADGAFGTLMLVYSLLDQKNYALRKVSEKNFVKPVEYMKKVESIDEMKLYTYYRFNGFVYMLQEYSPSDIYNCLKLQHNLKEEQMIKYCYEVLLAVKDYHKHNAENTTLHPSAFLLDRYGRISISQIEPLGEQVNSDSLVFMAPELLSRHQHADPIKADMWSLGVTFFFMATHSYPFFSKDVHSYIRLVKHSNYAIQCVQSNAIKQMVVRCLETNPNNRPTIEELLDMPIFDHLKSKSNPNKLGVERRQSQDGRMMTTFVHQQVPLVPRAVGSLGTRKLSRAMSLDTH